MEGSRRIVKGGSVLVQLLKPDVLGMESVLLAVGDWAAVLQSPTF